MVNHPGNQRLAVGDYTVQGCLSNILDLNEKNEFANSELIKAECVVVLASMILSELLLFENIARILKVIECFNNSFAVLNEK